MANAAKKKFGILKVLILVVVLIVAILIALPFIIDVNRFRPEIESQITSALGRVVKIGNLKLSLLSGGVSVDDFTIADDPAFSKSPFVRAKSLQVGVELKPLIFSKEVRITKILLDSPDINLIRSESGQWNFSNIGSQAAAKPAPKTAAEPGGISTQSVSIQKLEIKDGRITLKSGKKPSVYDKVNITASDLSFTSAFPFSMSAALPGAGSFKLEGKAGPLNQNDAMLTPLAADLTVKHLDLIASGFVEPEAGLSGIMDFNGKLESNGKLAQSKGRAGIDKLLVIKGGSPAPRPVSLNYAVNYDLANQSGTLSDAKVEFGKAVARLKGNYNMRGEALALKMRLTGNNMPVQDLQTLLPAFGVNLPKGAALEGGTLNTDMTAEGPLEKMVTAGTARISNTRLTGFDLSGKMATVASLVGIKPSQTTDIEQFSSGMRMTQAGIQVSDLLLIAPTLGKLSGNGTIASDQTLDFVMRAEMKPTGGLGGSLARLSKSGVLVVPFFIRGTTADPKFVPDTKKAASGLLESIIPGQGSKEGEGGQGIGDTLRNLFQKKK
jgi:AsmA protein